MRQVVFSEISDRLISAGVDGRIIVWNLNRPVFQVLNTDVRPLLATFDHDGAIVVAGWNGILQTIRPEDGTILTKSSLAGSPFASMTYPDCARGPLTTSFDGTLRVWNLAAPTGSQSFLLRGVSDTVFTDSTCDIITTVLGDGRPETITLSGVKPPRLLKAHQSIVAASAYNPEGSFLAVGDTDGQLTLWDIKSGNILGNVRAENGRFAGLGLTKNHLISGADGTLKAWRLPDLILDETANVGDASISTLFVDAHSSIVVVGCSDGTVSLWSLSPFHLKKKWHAHEQAVSSVDYDPGSALVVTGSLDGTSALWDSLSAEPLSFMDTQSGEAVQAKFGLNGKWILTNAGGSNVQVWRGVRPVRDAISRATEILGENTLQ